MKNKVLLLVIGMCSLCGIAWAQTDEQPPQPDSAGSEVEYMHTIEPVDYLSLFDLAADIEKTRDAIDNFSVKQNSLNTRLEKSYDAKDIRLYDNKVRVYSIGGGATGNYNFKFQQIYNPDLLCIPCGMGPLGPSTGNTIGIGFGFGHGIRSK